MSSYDPYDAPIRERERTSKRYYREERRDERDPRYEPRDGYLSPVSHDLVPRAREDSDLSVEEIRRDFPPPGYASRDIRRARSAGGGGGGYYDEYYDDRRPAHDRDRDYEHRSSRKGDSYYYDEEQKKKARVLSKQEQIIAAITGAAIAIGGKELYDRRDAKVHDSEVQRNVLASAALGAAGALAGYSGTELYNKQKTKGEHKSGALTHRGRSDYSSDEEDGKEKKGSKNFLEAALAAAGLGGAVKALTGGGKDDRSDTRSRGGSDAGSRSGKGEGSNKIQKAAMASLIAGATEAFRVSKEPGGWKGEKAKRVLTAAAGAATIDAAQKDGGSKLGLAESVLGGLLGNRVIHGSKKNIEEDEKTGRSRSRSRARSKSGDGGGGGVSGLAALATAGLGAIAGKKIMDGRKDDDDDDSRSRRRRSVDSRDSRDGSPKRNRSRSRSVVDKARRGLAKLGLGNAPEEEDDRDNDRRDRSRRDYDDYDDHKSSRRHRDDYDDYDRDRGHHKSSRRDDYSDEERASHRRDRSRPRGERSERGTVARRGSASSTDLGDTDEDEKRGKKMRGKQIITTGLATVATIHAAASVYQSMEKRKKRQKAVREGLLSPEEAKKLKQKAMWQDAASVGIAALGIKGAISEMHEVAEVRHELKEWEMSKEERRQRRRDRLRRRLSELRSGGSSDSSSSSSSDDEKGSRRRIKGNLRKRADNWSSVGPPKADRYGDGPRYSDGNPYAALPPPSPSGGRSDRG